MSEKIYPKGVSMKKPENAPAFVLARVGINTANGWCDFDLLNGDKGPYLVLNTYVPKAKEEATTTHDDIEPLKDAINPDDIPF